MNRGKFFAGVRGAVFHGHLEQGQVDGQNLILDEWEGSGNTDLRWLAYMLATTFHETGATMRPVHEIGTAAYFTRMYDIRGAQPVRAKRMGNTTPGDGIKYCGRGYAQLTWKNNYARMAALIHADLVGNPELAMDPKIAASVLFVGMAGETKNTFSGHSLREYFNDTREDWVGARRIVNGQDHARLIADTARAFYAALK
jgi:hypothetical protein